MKKFIYLFLALATLGAISCTDDNEDTLTGSENIGGYITVKNALVGYVVGNGNDTEYSASISAFQSYEKVVTVSVYNQFFNTSGDASNKVLLKTIQLPASEQYEEATFTFTYNELIAGLSINGSALPTDDGQLEIGDYWSLSYETLTESGKTLGIPKQTKVSVGTRFSGTYACVDGAYYRLGVLTYTGSDWPSETVIESVDAVTYKVNEYFGPFDGNEFYFVINSDDTISYPDNTPSGSAQLGNGQPMITCENSPSDMTNVPCSSANFVIRDDVDGKDQLVMAFGYYTTGSGPREFYQVLEKIVE